jgi:hypothetical protein
MISNYKEAKESLVNNLNSESFEKVRDLYTFLMKKEFEYNRMVAYIKYNAEKDLEPYEIKLKPYDNTSGDMFVEADMYDARTDGEFTGQISFARALMTFIDNMKGEI